MNMGVASLVLRGCDHFWRTVFYFSIRGRGFVANQFDVPFGQWCFVGQPQPCCRFSHVETTHRGTPKIGYTGVGKRREELLDMGVAQGVHVKVS